MTATNSGALRTPEEYRESLRDNRTVFYRGEPVDDVTTHPVLRHAVDHASLDYKMAEDPELRKLAVTENGYSRYFHVPQSGEDLLARSALIEAATRAGQDAGGADQGDRDRRAALRCRRWPTFWASRTRRAFVAFTSTAATTT